MQQSGPSVGPLDPADKRAAPPVKKLCIRCKQQKSAIRLQTAAFCHQCFHHNFEGKIHQGLEQSRLCTYLHRTEEEQRVAAGAVEDLPSGSHHHCCGRVVIGFSGGPSSRALLHIAKSRLLLAKGENARSGKLQEIHAVDVVYVDDSAVISGVEDRTAEVRAIVQEEGGESEGLYFWPMKLSDVFDDGEAAECTGDSGSLRYLSQTRQKGIDKDASLASLFESIQPSDTPKAMLSNARSRAEDLLALMTSHLLRRQAIRLGASCLLTAETSTRMAVRILDSVGKGRGHKLALEEGSIRWNGLFILRPLRDVTAKEVTLYSRGKQLKSLTTLDLVAAQLLSGGNNTGSEGGNGDKASMARLTESLIRLLERNVPSTVSTVNKVGDKLVFSDDLASHGYGDDEEERAAAAEEAGDGISSVPFQHLGPSVPLRLRRRPNSSATDSLSHLPLGTNGTIPGEAGDRSLQGLGLGRMGSTLYLAAKKMVPYHGALACPLCQMPSQRGLHAWKRGLTIRSTDDGEDEEREPASKQSNQINLTDLLCYACTMLLDTPDNTKPGTRIALPSFVLQGAQRRLGEGRGGGAVLSGEEIDAASALVTSKHQASVSDMGREKEGQHKPVLHKLDRAQMKKHLDGFLLNDEGQSNQRERRQTDW